MTAPTTAARDVVADVLDAAGLGVTVHRAPPESLSGPCIVLVPGDPWAARRGLSGQWQVVVDVVVMVPVHGGRSMLARLEDLTYQVAMLPLRRPPGRPDLPRVQVQKYGQGEWLACPIPTIADVKEETP